MSTLLFLCSFVGHTFRSEFLLMAKCQKTSFESRRPSRDTVNIIIIIFHNSSLLFSLHSCDWNFQEQTGMERGLTDVEEKAKMLQIA